ncbi:MAG: pilus assembly protein PilP [Steroidobacteraceae bacterium]
MQLMKKICSFNAVQLIGVGIRYLALGAALLTLGACADNLDELKQKVAEIKARPGERIEPLPEIKANEPFKYEASGERSPFTPSTSAKSNLATSARPDVQRPREFLEQFPLDTLQMVGTLQLQGKTFGLLQGKDGLVHRVQVGSHLGQSDGRVTSITPSKVSVIELVADGLGGYIERPAALSLKE